MPKNMPLVIVVAVFFLCVPYFQGTAVESAAEGDVDSDIVKANSYDDAWEAEWVAHLKKIHKRADNKTDGFVIHIGDSITHYRGYSLFPINYKADDDLGKTVVWSKASGLDTDQAEPDCKNGWSLSYSNQKSAREKWRSYTACKGITARGFLRGASKSYWFVAGPNDKEPLDRLLNNTSTEPIEELEGLRVAIVHDAQIAVVMLGTNDVGTKATIPDITADLKQIIEKLVAKDILPIITTIPPRKEKMDRVIPLNDEIRKLAKELEIPLIDFQLEIMRRRTGESWQTTLIGKDGVHLTNPGYKNPIEVPQALCDNGNLLRGFLTVCKIMEVKKYVIDGLKAPSSKSGNSDAFSIDIDSLPNGKVGEAYEFQLIASGGVEPYKWSGLGLPKGLKVSSAGIIRGTPRKASTSTVKLKVKDKKFIAVRLTIDMIVE